MKALPAALAWAVLASGTAGAEGLAPGDVQASLAGALADVRKRVGPEASVLAIEIHAEETAIQVQDPAVPSHVDRHVYGPTGLHVETEPVAVGRNLRELRARLFRLREVDASVLPPLLASAPVEVDTEGGAVTQVVLDRQEGSGEYPVWGPPRWRVHVAGPRGGGSVEYALDGKRKRVIRW